MTAVIQPEGRSGVGARSSHWAVTARRISLLSSAIRISARFLGLAGSKHRRIGNSDGICQLKTAIRQGRGFGLAFGRRRAEQFQLARSVRVSILPCCNWSRIRVRWAASSVRNFSSSGMVAWPSVIAVSACLAVRAHCASSFSGSLWPLPGWLYTDL